jgi:hypothetical protein
MEIMDKFLRLLMMKRTSPNQISYSGDDRHGFKYRVTEIFVSGRQDIALRLINPGLGSAYLLCGASPVFSCGTQYRNR